MNSGEFETSANVGGTGKVVVTGKWELAGDMIRVKTTPANGRAEETILYKVRKAEPTGLILVKDQKEVVILFRHL
jgi:hypothetical protein